MHWWEYLVYCQSVAITVGTIIFNILICIILRKANKSKSYLRTFSVLHLLACTLKNIAYCLNWVVGKEQNNTGVDWVKSGDLLIENDTLCYIQGLFIVFFTIWQDMLLLYIFAECYVLFNFEKYDENNKPKWLAGIRYSTFIVPFFGCIAVKLVGPDFGPSDLYCEVNSITNGEFDPRLDWLNIINYSIRWLFVLINTLVNYKLWRKGKKYYTDKSEEIKKIIQSINLRVLGYILISVLGTIFQTINAFIHTDWASNVGVIAILLQGISYSSVVFYNENGCELWRMTFGKENAETPDDERTTSLAYCEHIEVDDDDDL